jgi:methylisocitrate lyase
MSILRDNINMGAKELRKQLNSKKIIIAPGVSNGLSAIIAERAGFKTLYMSGSGVAGTRGLPDLSVISLDEVAYDARNIIAVSRSPLIVDVDTGFGEPLNVIRTVRMMESLGAAAIHMEDQVLPKKCGHLNGKAVVGADAMIQKIYSAVKARKDKNFVIIARTDARAVEGLDAAIERSNLYAGAGADAIFTEALESESEFKECVKKIHAPLLANMTEFGRSPLISAKDLESIGYKIVIFPLTAFRGSALASKKVYEELARSGTQKNIINSIMTRGDFYSAIGYDEYEKEDDETSRLA